MMMSLSQCKIAFNKAREIDFISLCFFSIAFVLIALFSFCAELKNNNNYICRYIAKDSQFGDSVKVTFNIDSSFLKMRKGIGCWDDGGICHTFGNEQVSIVMNSDFRSRKSKSNLDPSLKEIGESNKMKIKDAYLDRKINEPELLTIGILKGVFVESYGIDSKSIDYVGYSQNPFVYFDIYIDSTHGFDVKPVLLSIINSISIQEM